VYVGVTGQHSSEVSGTQQCCIWKKTVLSKLCAQVNGFIFQNIVFNTVDFVIPFKCWKVSGGHEHPFVFHSTWMLLGRCGRMSWLVSFLPPSFLFQLVSVVCLCGRLNLGMQVTKPVLFSTACEGLQNYLLCWS